MVTGVRVAICPMTMSANIGHVTSLPIAPIPSVVTFVPVVKVTGGMDTNVPILTNVPTPPSLLSVSRMPSAVTSPPTTSANAKQALKAMAKSSAEISTSV